MTFEQLLYLFQIKHRAIDETEFYFSDDQKKLEHYIGYVSKYEKPYWIGYCDIKDGCDFLTADELFYAKVFDGKSIKERWNKVVLLQIGGIDVDTWFEMYGQCLKEK